MNLENFKHNIDNYQEYHDYLVWMGTINGKTWNEATTISPDMLIGGYCEDFAAYFCYKYDLPMLDLDGAHCLVKVDGLYYDGYNNHGVCRLQQLEFVKRTPHYRILMETQLEGPLKVYEDWKTYDVFTRNFYLINKQEEPCSTTSSLICTSTPCTPT